MFEKGVFLYNDYKMYKKIDLQLIKINAIITIPFL